MTAALRYMQEEYFPRQRDALAGFTTATGITVEADFLPVDPFWHDARRACGSPPRWDLMAPDEVIVAEHLAHDRLLPLDDLAARDGVDLVDWFRPGIDRFRLDGRLYAIPYVAMANVLIYRQDILDRYDLPVPSTWDELGAVARQAQAALRRDGNMAIAGFTSRGLAGYGHNFWIVGSTLFPSWGWEWNRGPGAPPKVHTPATVEALAFYASLLQEAGPPGSAQLTFTDTHALYARGEAVFLLDAATELATMRRASAASAGPVSSLAVVPDGPAGRPEPGLYSPAYCIPRTTERPEEAWALLRHLISVEEVANDTFAGGYAEPARRSIVESAAYAEAFGEPFQAVVQETRRHARINRPLIPNGFDLGEIVGAAAEAAIAGRQTADEALAAAQRQIDALDWPPPAGSGGS